MSNFQNFDFEHGSTDEHTPFESPADLREELTKLRAKMDKRLQELKKWEIMPFQEWYSMICNEE
eukprot:10808577-Ditylum_brightwellii.AAC.1